jgi:hypothetical protein
MFMGAASDLGMHVVDMAELFAPDYAVAHRKFDYYPFDRHWNGYANGIAASKVLALLAPPAVPVQAFKPRSVMPTGAKPHSAQ